MEIDRPDVVADVAEVFARYEKSQTWIRHGNGWRVVSAHVSWEDGRAPGG